MSSKAPASTANHASSIRPIWARPKKSLPWSRTAPPQCPYRLPCAILDCPAPCGLPPSRPVSFRCWSRSGLSPAPAPRRPTMSCWPPFTAFVSRVPRPRSPTGITVPSYNRCGTSRQSASPHKPSGMSSRRFCRRSGFRCLSPTIRWSMPNCACWLCGRKNRAWATAACWPTIPPTFTPILPAPTPAMNWRSADIISRAVTICGRWVSAMFWTGKAD